MDVQQFEGRKRDHLRHALNPAHQASGLSGLEQIHLSHEALPELDFGEVRLAAPFLGRSLRTPFYIAGMTAGHADAVSLNRTLARACAERGWILGVGSQRRQLEGADSIGLDRWREIREEAPGLVLIANIGAAQLIEAPIERVRALVEATGAQALAIHLNALQECLQPEGTPRLKGASEAIRRACRELGVPVIVKETGCGFSAPTLARMKDWGLAAVDVSGLGGTHWGRIEGARAKETASEAVRAAAAETFAAWGEPTVASVLAARDSFAPRGDEKIEIWASGGARSGLDAAKLIALGASRVGYAKPALEKALEGAEALRGWMERQEFELEVALFCTGSPSPEALRRKEGSWGWSGSKR